MRKINWRILVVCFFLWNEFAVEGSGGEVQGGGWERGWILPCDLFLISCRHFDFKVVAQFVFRTQVTSTYVKAIRSKL